MKVRWREEQDDTEGHAVRPEFKRDDGSEIDLSKVTKIAFTDDEGNEQEVEGHVYQRFVSDLRLKRSVAPLAGALDRLRSIWTG